ncbi:hypothetical protein GJ496_010914 [Pomphorhynchus laevis]|nr:hypothetical protein GJ496_010914 [Pomphorhynchus laevis]
MDNSTTPIPDENEPNNGDVRRAGKKYSDNNKMRVHCPACLRMFISTSSDLPKKHGPVCSDNPSNNSLNKAHGSVSALALLPFNILLLADNVQTIRRIRSGAKPYVAAKLSEIMDAVVSHSDEEAVWCRMICFPKVDFKCRGK